MKFPIHCTRMRTLLYWLCILILITAVPGQLFGQGTVDSETCLGCHDDYDQSLLNSAHRLGASGTSSTRSVACGSCHTGGDVHVEDPSVENIGNPSTASVLAVTEVCTVCHQPHQELDQVNFDPHITQGLACGSCHTVHGGSPGLLVDDSGEFCGKCHTDIKRQFQSRSNHPVNDGVVACWSCHSFSGRYTSLGVQGSETCLGCHGEHAGPFMFEHGAISSFIPETNGCIECHAAHGSANDRLLTQPDDALCRQCHGLPPRHLAPPQTGVHEGVVANADCVACHSDIHGSDNNPNLLDPMLGTKVGDGPGSCFCHNVEG